MGPLFFAARSERPRKGSLVSAISLQAVNPGNSEGYGSPCTKPFTERGRPRGYYNTANGAPLRDPR